MSIKYLSVCLSVLKWLVNYKGDCAIIDIGLYLFRVIDIGLYLFPARKPEIK